MSERKYVSYELVLLKIERKHHRFEENPICTLNGYDTAEHAELAADLIFDAINVAGNIAGSISGIAIEEITYTCGDKKVSPAYNCVKVLPYPGWDEFKAANGYVAYDDKKRYAERVEDRLRPRCKSFIYGEVDVGEKWPRPVYLGDCNHPDDATENFEEFADALRDGTLEAVSMGDEDSHANPLRAEKSNGWKIREVNGGEDHSRFAKYIKNEEFIKEYMKEHHGRKPGEWTPEIAMQEMKEEEEKACGAQQKKK